MTEELSGGEGVLAPVERGGGEPETGVDVASHSWVNSCTSLSVNFPERARRRPREHIAKSLLGNIGAGAAGRLFTKMASSSGGARAIAEAIVGAPRRGGLLVSRVLWRQVLVARFWRARPSLKFCSQGLFRVWNEKAPENAATVTLTPPLRPHPSRVDLGGPNKEGSDRLQVRAPATVAGSHGRKGFLDPAPKTACLLRA